MIILANQNMHYICYENVLDNELFSKLKIWSLETTKWPLELKTYYIIKIANSVNIFIIN